MQATLFGLTIDDWKNFASLLLSPVVGITIIYILGVDLVKIPFLSIDVPYRIPVRFVQASTGLLGMLFALSVSAWLTLRLYEGPRPHVESFKKHFFRQLSDDEAAWLKRANELGVVGGRLSILDYDGKSDVRVFADNVRVFGTHVDCVAIYQCGHGRAPNLAELEQTYNLKLNTNVYPLEVANYIPFEREFKLRADRGKHSYIDIFVNNSGLGTCRVSMSIELYLADGTKSKMWFTFSDRDNFALYRTERNNPSYRICDQVRLPIGA
jgi:hypothetical protein